MPVIPRWIALTTLVIAAACSPAPGDPGRPAAPATDSSLLDVPLYFVENRGQADPRVGYYLQGADTSVYFTEGGLTFSLSDREGTAQRWTTKLEFLGATRVAPTPEDRAEAVVSYFKGSPDDWETGVPTYSRLVYPDLWPGIDLAYRGDRARLKYELVVHPGADPGDIRLSYRGADVSLRDGGLLVETPAGSFTDDPPRSWQVIDGHRAPVESSFDLRGRTYGFRIGTYDPTQPLVIDPAIVVYAGFLGGSGTDKSNDVAVDASGAVYLTGETDSTQATFPVAVGPDLTYEGSNDVAFVAKVDPSGGSLVYAGYIGGGSGDVGKGIAVDPSGAAYLTGHTGSPEVSFPVTVGPDLTFNGSSDAFVAKVAPSGTSLVYAGYLGGSGSDLGEDVAVDASGAAFVTGYGDSGQATFPDGDGFGSLGGPDLTYNGGTDAFVAKVVPSGSSLSYAGYLGGSGQDLGVGVALDPSGAAYLGGETASGEATFPDGDGLGSLGGPDLTYGGATDGFVAKVAPSGASLAYAGYVGGSGTDYGSRVAVDGSGAAYVVGSGDSTEATFPVTVGPDLTANGSFDAFVAKVAPSGTAFEYAGFLGGSGGEAGRGVAVDPSGAAYLTGRTTSTEATFPETAGPDLTYGGATDGFVAKVAPSGTSLAYAGFVGGSGIDDGFGVAVDGAGAAYVVGETTSTEATFPAAAGPDLTANGGTDAFVAKVTDNLCLGKGVTIQGTAGADTIVGTAGDDVILALGGDDAIDGGGGNDTICAGEGNDVLTGGAGDDALDGEAGTDTASFPGTTGVVASLAAGTSTGQGSDTLAGIEKLDGSSAADTLTGDAGDNVLNGFDGDDVIEGGGGSDTIDAGDGKDKLFGAGGTDVLNAGKGNDRAKGGAGKDVLKGGPGKDRLSGGAGADRMNGGAGADRLGGGGGKDRLNGGKGSDTCNGGGGGTDSAKKCETVNKVP